MKLMYYNNAPVFFYNQVTFLNTLEPQNCIINYQQGILKNYSLFGNVFIVVEKDSLYDLILELKSLYFIAVTKIIVIVKHCDSIENYMNENFETIFAAGGIVQKNDSILMEYRYQLWDLPKGHIEQNEDAQSAAVREVLEETNVKANIVNYCSNSQYFILEDGKIKIKDVQWYHMICIDNSNMTPQTEEHIEMLSWIPIPALYNVITYNSIKHLLVSFINRMSIHE